MSPKSSPTKKIKWLIIGAGPTGIGAAHRLSKLSENDFLVLEKSNQIGGLATSYRDDKGFVWDIGGHVQFSHYEYFDQAMLEALPKEQWYHHQRESWVWIKERFVPYPFQNNIHRLDPADCQNCLQGLRDKNKKRGPENFKEWLSQSFGEELCRIFMHPYNYKVWAYYPEELSYSWIGERVAEVDLEKIEQNIKLSRDDVSWGPNSTFQFPKLGGTGAIWQGLADKIGQNQFQLQTCVEKIDSQKKLAYTDSGVIEYQHLLSTMPLDLFCQKIEGLPSTTIETAKKLKHSSSHIFGIGLEGKLPAQLEGKCWMYFPEENCPFYRVTVFSHYSPQNVPGENYFSLMAEVSESPQKPVDKQKLMDQVIEGLQKTKLIDLKKQQIVSKWQFHAAYGYPTPSLERDQILNSVQPELEKRQLFSRGRFGAWKYEVSNQDHSFMQGVEWVDQMVHNKKEKTYYGID